MMIRFIIILMVSSLQASGIPKIKPDSLKFISKFCIDCHDSELEEGGLDFSKLATEIKNHKVADIWYNVLNSINAGEMPPPKKKKQPSNEEKAKVLNGLSKTMVQARAYLNDSHGKVTMRRLSKTAYKNTIKDLLGVEVNSERLPNDGGEKTYDTFGASLYFSSGQLLEYISLARNALEIVLIKNSEPKVYHYNPKSIIDHHLKKKIDAVKEYMGRVESFFADPAPESKEKFERYRLESRSRIEKLMVAKKKELGSYELFQRLAANDMDAGVLSNFGSEIYVNTKDITPGKYHLSFMTGTIEKGKPSYLTISQKENSYERTIKVVKVTGSFEDHQKVEMELNVTPEIRHISISPTQKKFLHKAYVNTLEKHQKLPGIAPWLKDVVLYGPLPSPEEEVIKKQIFPEFSNFENEDAYAFEVLDRFYTRATRGKVISKELMSKLMTLFHQQRHAGKTYKKALVEPLAIILSLPEFLFLPEPASEKPFETKLDDFQLATRLSYFLWNSMPDQELISLANQGLLSDSDTLDLQVSRMLKDEKSYRFIESFCSQWLHLDRLDLFQFEERYYDLFEYTAKASAKTEVYKTFQMIMQKGLGVHKLLNPGFVVIDENLADHYEIEGITGSDFKQVNVSDHSSRGGLLTMVATLALGSDGVVSSPVERGAWILRKLVNNPPAPAPADVPELQSMTKGLGKREILMKHTEQPQCFQCHSKIDPLGIALEDFDASGKIRRPIKVSKKKQVYEVNSKNIKTDVYNFTDFEGMRNYVREQEQPFIEGFIEELTAYALGREMSFSDENLLKSINLRSEKDGYRILSIIKAIVFSKAFRYK